MNFIKKISALLILLIAFSNVNAQKRDSAYVRVITERSWKIVQKLDIENQDKAIKVRDIIANQYMNLNDVYEIRDAKKKEIKSSAESKEEKERDLAKVETWVNKKIDKLHRKYINQLDKNLTSEQVIGVKDGMTYGVVPLTFRAYQEMLPNLTKEQKNQIYIWLVEAREHAMDAESSDKKHAWFGKYKGKVNNYLSVAGIDMKKAGEEWQERIKASKAK